MIECIRGNYILSRKNSMLTATKTEILRYQFIYFVGILTFQQQGGKKDYIFEKIVLFKFGFRNKFGLILKKKSDGK